MMENVPGLATKGRPLLEALLNELQGHGYHPNVDVLQVADFGVPNSENAWYFWPVAAFASGCQRPRTARIRLER